MLIPYRVKNPVKRFPVASLVLAAANVVVFALTSKYFLVLKEEAVLSYGFISGQTPFFNLLTYMFVHGDIFHLLGNTLFLWIFSGPVEDRIGVRSYLFVYFCAGIVGGIAQDAFGKFVIGHPVPLIGASGAVMGVMGAYLYMFPWSRVRVFYWFLIFVRGTFEISAIWVIGGYFAFDVFYGLFYGVSRVFSGVGHLAHVFGFAAGFVFCRTIHAKRDAKVLSTAKAEISEYDFSLIDIWTLRGIVEAEPENAEAIRALMDKSVIENRRELIEDVLRKAGPRLIETAPSVVGRYLNDMGGDFALYPPGHLVKLAGMLRKDGQVEESLKIYRSLLERFPDGPEAEMALWRTAQIHWNEMKDGPAALSAIEELEARFPNGKFVPYARSLQREMQSPLPRRKVTVQ
ncbi:MAG TPA: rhomboid family intramembrane serine protease [Thermodesulfobacteriota bacterium]|nr:rhomboid family intramembrane serine protease [Thermodesulfobacteriota bacterium]